MGGAQLLMPLAVRNRDYLRAKDVRQAEMVDDIINGLNRLEAQVSGNVNGQPPVPPPVHAVQVSGRDGYLHVAITDNNGIQGQGGIYRGLEYYVDHADNPGFANAVTEHLGPRRNVTIPVGSQTRYVRAYSAYQFGSPSQPVVHGGNQPIGTVGGGSGPGPLFLPSQGSGTGAPGVGAQGPGATPFRSTNGKPPIR